MQSLADTTAESETSVKSAHPIGIRGLVADGHAGRSTSPQSSALTAADQLRNGTPSAASGAATDPAQLFQSGQDALNAGRLDEAEHDFRKVLAADPQAGAAYANLGVVYMRRKQWAKALATLRQAEHLMPQVPGIRLNVGLVVLPAK